MSKWADVANTIISRLTENQWFQNSRADYIKPKWLVWCFPMPLANRHLDLGKKKILNLLVFHPHPPITLSQFCLLLQGSRLIFLRSVYVWNSGWNKQHTLAGRVSDKKGCVFCFQCNWFQTANVVQERETNPHGLNTWYCMSCTYDIACHKCSYSWWKDSMHSTVSFHNIQWNFMA